MHGLRLSIFVVTAHEFDAFWREALSSWLELLTILYNSLCVVFFQAFYCVDLPGGYSLLRLATCRTTSTCAFIYTRERVFIRVVSVVALDVPVVEKVLSEPHLIAA